MTEVVASAGILVQRIRQFLASRNHEPTKPPTNGESVIDPGSRDFELIKTTKLTKNKPYIIKRACRFFVRSRPSSRKRLHLTTMRTSKARAGKRKMMRFVILSSTLMAGALAFHTAAPELSARQTPRSAVTPINRTPSSQNWGKERKPRHIYHAIAWRQGTSEDNSSVSMEDIVIPTPYPTPDHDEITTVDIAVLTGTTTFAAISLFALITLSAPGSWRYFLAGGICAATSHAIAVPIDVVKTRKQIDPKLFDKPFLKASRHILMEEGVVALWAGLGPTVCGYLLEGAIKFGVYEVLKPAVKNMLSNLSTFTSIGLFQSQLLAYVVCATVSGLAASLMLCPMEALRIRMVAEPEYARCGMIAGGLLMLKREGVSGLAKGIKPMILKQVPYTVTKNVSFDFITKLFYSIMRAQGLALTAASAFTVPLVSAGIASVLSCVSSQPGDMVLSLVNAHEGDVRSSDIRRDIMRSERGFWGFFVGFKTRMLHVGIIVTLQLLIYDYVKRLCGIAATGL